MPIDHAQASLAWMLELTWAGRLWRFTTVSGLLDTSVTDRLSGPFLPLTVTDMVQGIDTGSVAPELMTASLELDFGEVDVAALVAEGHKLTLAEGVLFLVDIDATLDDRQVIIEGRLNRPIYGELGEVVRCSLVEERAGETASHPHPEAKLSARSAPEHYTGQTGAVYPTVWGTPGILDSDDGAELVGATPVLAAVYDTDFYADVLVATTEELTFSSAPSPDSATLGTASPSIDGVALSVGDRILIKDQTGTGSGGAGWNGIWEVDTIGGGATILDRASDMDDEDEVVWGRGVAATDGVVNGGTRWEVDAAYTAGSLGDPIYFQEYESKVDEVVITGHHVAADVVTLTYDVTVDGEAVVRHHPVAVENGADDQGRPTGRLDLRALYPGSRKQSPQGMRIGWGQWGPVFGARLSIRSTSSGDTTQTITLTGWDEDLVYQETDHTLTGTTEIFNLIDWGRIDTITLDGVAAGSVLIQDQETGRDIYEIPAGELTAVARIHRTGGGLPGVRTLGDLVAWWARRSSVRWDHDLVETGRTTLDQVVSGWVTAGDSADGKGIQPLPFIEHLLQPYPASLRTTSRGMAAVSHRAGPPVAHLEGPDVVRITGVEAVRDDDEVRTTFALEWAIDGDGTALRTSILSGDPDEIRNGAHTTEWLRVAAADFPGERVETLRGMQVWRAVDAWRLLLDHAARMSVVPDHVQVEVPQDALGLDPGLTVTWTEPPMAWIDKRFVIIDREVTDVGRVGMLLETVEI